MDYNFMNYNCIEYLSEQDKNRFKKLVEHFAPKLNKVNSSNGTVFTPHDFDHHCKNIYHIISNVILTESAFKNGGLTNKELYILDIAVLLHDIGLTKESVIERERHAIVSSDMIDKLYKNSECPLSKAMSGLGRKDMKALKLIVKAHSDVKNEEKICALDDKELNNDMKSVNEEKIRGHFLANVLRLADELDVTNDRFSDIDIMNQLSEANMRYIKEKSKVSPNEDLIVQLNNSIESLEYWKKLYYFEAISRKEDGTVEIEFDDDYIEDMHREGASLEEIVAKAFEVYEKLQKEFKKFNNDIASSYELVNLVGVKRIILKSNNSDINAIINKRKVDLVNDAKDKKKQSVVVLSESVENQITRFVNKRKLLDGGHYYRKDGYCARDWINVKEIMGTNSFFKKGEKLILNATKNIIDSNSGSSLIIGIDFSGMLIGSKAAITLGIPYTFAIPVDNEIDASENELKITLEDNYENVIIMTDVIVTYNTILRLVKKYRLEEKIIAIFGILYREPQGFDGMLNNQEEVEKLYKITYVLNKQYPIELHCNKDCKIIEQYGCIAKNIKRK